ncbi:putative tRNA uridine 5-carboxymethylaminomethyl modification enzyme GidA [Leptolyngbya boryana NIES-2135]|jgi:pyruvate/2-oxoglutarate dehydrogenase complex dihydrolipoamide dehydrogenase (E3) component|uniref:Putative tRNA uridine 5-carboxymethylaminomethyl modification enzyme GidA n=1 Tax=Leptolyngbya boryana NIES-2135 TaxID=1973484 RepID=A0A1Z4JFN2_LEPBY|nr:MULTISPECIES: mercuric reductase [Leptolyngbya]BAY55530.1 putative tRNA uridine 5-carboxymethylaminomethyl modification enzyme GidA [Leptolyngbya boryana NIES-2135]MBD2368319.1 mercuric reductase [Leptolyngbya sp. FACHB-161]MBD2375025.1 mercuric reductase [Leptolyngbya sp. FACHB-238]MBD2399445.1 mercuric reductase [Leptolyngbya sp. FACHB-239]MBD2405650.1 mercuric reductase [Leptolyngbya sp. FACHB-402]
MSLISPDDVHNQLLVSRVHPPDWVNPQPSDRYDLVVLGAGTAGLVVAAGAAGLGIGLKVALIEKHLMGGDCLNVGCVPSKCMIRSSRVVAEMRDARSFGVIPPDTIEVDFPAVMERMRQLRAGISENDSADRFKKLGVDVFLGEASFLDRDRIQVSDRILNFKKAVIATGARARDPEIPGLAEAGYLTNETVFSLTDRPRRLAVIGGGAIGCELAQTFQRLGCEVMLFHKHARLLDREDPDAAELLQQVFLKEGIRVILNCNIDQVRSSPDGKVIDANGESFVVDEILVGAGRAPNVEGLNLEAVGVNYDRKGVKVNDYLQTTNPRIYAAGDICMDWKYTHAADAAARIVIKNALFSPFGFGRSKLSSLTMPWVTYTDPEIAHVGIYESDNAELIKITLDKVDRAIADGETNGFIKLLHRTGSDEILGATIVARHAGEMISEITTAIVGKRGLNTLSTVIHPYPTQAEMIKKAADAYRRKLLTPTSRKLLGLLTKFS